MAREKPPTTADKLAYMLSVVAPDLDIEAQLDEVAVKGNGDLVWSAPEPEKAEADGDEPEDGDEQDEANQSPVTDSGDESESNSDSDSEMTRTPPAGRKREERVRRKETSRKQEKSPSVVDKDHPDYSFEQDLEQWIAGDQPSMAT